MQNEPNFGKAQMNVNKVLTKDYENKTNWTLGENEPKTNPIKPNFRQEMPKMPRRNHPAPGPAASRQGQARRLFGKCVVRLLALSRGPHFPKMRNGNPRKNQRSNRSCQPKKCGNF
jgi:hypothetical protein